MSETPPLSVVIASVNGMPYVARCLDALARNAPEAEVIVADATDEATRAEVAERFPTVRLIEADGAATVPALRAAGIAAARAPYVAVIEDHCLVRPGWASRIVEWHRERQARGRRPREQRGRRAAPRLGRVLLRVQRLRRAHAARVDERPHRDERLVRPAGDRGDAGPSRRRAVGGVAARTPPRAAARALVRSRRS